MHASQIESKFSTEAMVKYIPVTKRPHVRTDRSVPNNMDIYGLRPLRSPWMLLSPYEFLRYWKAEPLLPPPYYATRRIDPRTKWTTDGELIAKSDAYKSGQIVLKPGVHFVVVEPKEDAKYAVFPHEPAHLYGAFRHTWVIVRKRRPEVVVIEGLKMPRATRPAADNAKYCSLFFRKCIQISEFPETLLSVFD